MNPLLDKEFLKKLDQHYSHEIFAKIISLNMKENPIEEIQGKVSQGTINLDGSSSVRRSCSLTLVAENVNINEYYWGLTTKFRLFIGLTNEIDSTYDDIIWFPQGTYVIADFKTSQTTNNYTITISGKDKMCFLNGDVGGALPMEVDFGKVTNYDTDENGDMTSTTTDLPIKYIINEMIHKYGNEPFYNIIIKDLSDTGLELLDYKGDDDIYLIKNEQGIYEDIILDGDTIKYTKNGTAIALSDSNFIYEQLVANPTNTPTKVKNSDSASDTTYYTIAKCQSGQAVGYRITDLTYTGDLIAQAGETITSILDKIVKMLGNYEYFYDLDGRFVFQKKISYVSETLTNITNIEDEQYEESSKLVSQISYNFSDSNLVTSFANTPAFSNIKNDFAIWGKKKSVTGDTGKVPIHLRYAIDKKPTYYKAYDGTEYCTVKNINYTKTTNLSLHGDDLSEDWWDVLDWAEMYKAYTGDYPDKTLANYCETKIAIDLDSIFDSDDTYGSWTNYCKTLKKTYETAPINVIEVEEKNGKHVIGEFWHYFGCGHTYDKFIEWYNEGKYFYVYKPEIPVSELVDSDGIVDWREIIYQMANDYYQHYHEDDFEITIARNNPDYYPTGKTGYEQYYEDIFGFWRDVLYDPSSTDSENFYCKDATGTTIKNLYWNRIIDTPENLLFWFDFMDAPGSELEKLSVPAIGDRTKVINQDEIKVIYYGEVPEIIYITKEKYEYYEETNQLQSGYTYVFLPETMEDYFSISVQGKSAQEQLDDSLYQYAWCNENITLTAIPIYYLDVNTRIGVNDKSSNIEGEYIINKISFNLSHTGMMQITATKAPTNLY